MEPFFDLIHTKASDEVIVSYVLQHSLSADSLGQTVLHHLVTAERSSLLRDLFQRFFDTESLMQVKDCWGNTPAHYVKDYETAVVIWTACPNVLKIPNSCKETPLHKIVNFLSPKDLGNALVQFSPDLEAVDGKGQSVKDLILGRWNDLQQWYWKEALEGILEGFVAFRSFAAIK
jgi:hypothetical protein